MPTTYVVRMDPDQYETAMDALAFAKLQLGKKDKEKISGIEEKMLFAQQHPDMGRYEAFLTAQEGELLNTISEGFNLGVDVRELK